MSTFPFIEAFIDEVLLIKKRLRKKYKKTCDGATIRIDWRCLARTLADDDDDDDDDVMFDDVFDIDDEAAAADDNEPLLFFFLVV